ncbi:hypothetical protein Pyrde_1346 [Pyrodictium delaneyi]|uniref:Uncharacterized protein n=1 Tax=Pyrodictium delaneyi TaxID=1273541 RepID=A0A0P0N5A0_9CREN|nr:winged helix-turn-helix domain-containing protein [Pyrodictium delaneyi]ALL01392.1 hypothetical protein Pyrde_1346 [Pyrodictium delaneyi]OWJ54509.1 hypothetical protein Pdsh_06850 [Pyrodictium delaneyi]
MQATLQQVATLAELAGHPQPRLVAINPHEPATAIAQILDTLDTKTTATAIIEHTTPETTLAIALALLIHTARTEKTATIRTTETTIPLHTVHTILTNSLPGIQRRIANHIHANGPATIPQLAASLNLSERTIRRHTRTLQRLQLLTQRANLILPTPWLTLYHKTNT